MAFEGSSFNLWNDSDLTDQFSGSLSLVHYTNLSDNPQDFLLYLGSPTAARVLQATSNPGVDNITLTPTDISPEWVTATAYIVGDMVIPTTPNGYIYRCTDAGTSAGSEPTWPTVGIGSTVVDGGVIWELYAAHHPATEIKLALTSGGLDSATGGAPLTIGTEVDSEIANAVEVHVRITNTVTSVSNNTGNEEIAIYINACIELGTV